MANTMLHVQMTITINNDIHDWYDPQIKSTIDFDIPEEIFNSASFAKAVDARITQLKKDFPQAITDHEARVKREEAERVQREAEKHAKLVAEMSKEEAEIDSRLGNVIMTPS